MITLSLPITLLQTYPLQKWKKKKEKKKKLIELKLSEINLITLFMIHVSFGCIPSFLTV